MCGRERERGNRELAERKERKARVDGGGVLIVNLRGFDRSISPSLPHSGVPAQRERERERVSSAQVSMDKICCNPKRVGSKVVVSSLPPCSLSLLRRGAETGAAPVRSPVPSAGANRAPCASFCPGSAAAVQFSVAVISCGHKNLKAAADAPPVQ